MHMYVIAATREIPYCAHGTTDLLLPCADIESRLCQIEQVHDIHPAGAEPDVTPILEVIDKVGNEQFVQFFELCCYSQQPAFTHALCSVL
jgi:hypothetical protein